jgi:hypothetical protein
LVELSRKDAMESRSDAVRSWEDVAARMRVTLPRRPEGEEMMWA